MTLYSPLGLNQHLLIFTGAFFAVLGITALLVVKNTDRKINKAVIQTMVLDESHMGNMVKYDNYDNDVECDECSNTTEELD